MKWGDIHDRPERFTSADRCTRPRCFRRWSRPGPGHCARWRNRPGESAMRVRPEVTAKLDENIVRLLALDPQTALQLCNTLNVGRHVLQRRLDRLHDAGMVHVRPNPSSKIPRAPRLWAEGLGLNNSPAAGTVPVRLLTKDGPVHNRRDPLVAALFGQPANAPRCIDCRHLQGEQHASDCRVAEFV